MKSRFGPVLRLTIAMIGITLALVLCAQALRILPDAQAEAMAHRKRTVEALTVQITSPVMLENIDAVTEVLDAVVERNPEVISVGLRDTTGELLVEAGGHQLAWRPVATGRSTPEYVRVPIFLEGEEAAALEVRFRPLPSPWTLSFEHGSVLALLLFVGVLGGGGYFMVLRRSLRALDPAAVIPDRVRLAMDTLVEGVLIMDESQNILLANSAFASYLGVPVEQLLGRSASALNWRSSETGGAPPELPWLRAMSQRAAVTDVTLELRSAAGDVCVFTVNATPVIDNKGRVQGALASFDDVTDLQQRNSELKQTLVELEESRRSVERHNAELRFLATRDPLTGCLNRRAFFESFEQVLASARAERQQLCCAMIDIDHFKQINDRFGHGTGDRVIAFVAEAIRLKVGAADLVCRYGGEEYCVVLVGRTLDEARLVLEQIRTAIVRDASARFTASLRLSVSSGLTELLPNDERTGAPLERADAALYAAKAGGRNRVEAWRPEMEPGTGGTGVRPGPAATAATGTWRGLMRDEKLRPVAERSASQAAEDAFRDQVNQMLALAERHSWTAALLRIEFESVGVLSPQATAELLNRVSTLLRRSDMLGLLLGERAAQPGGGSMPSVSSIGPMEVGVLLPDVPDIRAIGRIVQRMVRGLSEPLLVDGSEAYVSCAIGIGVAPADGEDFDTLMHCAEQARRAVRIGQRPERYAFYQPEMTASMLQTMRMESGLRRALDSGGFRLVYQPQVDLSSGAVTGFEALIRWTDANGQAVPPDQFIPVAEACGLILPIGDWVLRTACLQARNWQQVAGTPLRVAVNVSAVQVMSADFVPRVASILRETEVEPRLVELEITETAFMSDLVTAAQTLRELRRLGLHISLDDFGTGYSSLSYLKQLPIDSVKIDSRFVRDFNETREGVALISAIVGMAHGLGIRVVAEGVETHESMEMLRSLGCDHAQGYVISRPVEAPQAVALLTAQFDTSTGVGDTSARWRRLAAGLESTATAPSRRAAGRR
jgi:diguanylate cyclase (GGDEF)-like protein/PAS domain S-box-containing protein